MKPPDAEARTLHNKTFLLVVIAVTLAFAWILWPFFGALFWGAALAILFTPLYRRLCNAMGRRRTPAALTSVLITLGRRRWWRSS